MKNAISRLFQPAESYTLVCWLFLRLLALIYIAAFWSLAIQISGLAGPDGILPYQELLDKLYNHYGRHAWWRMPTLFWFNSSSLGWLRPVCPAFARFAA